MEITARAYHQHSSPEAGANLNLSLLRSQTPKSPGRALRRALTQNASEEGLSYNSCKQLREILNDGFRLVGTQGVWDNATTARNMIFVALDSIPEFRRPRLEYTRLLRHAATRPLTEPEFSRLDTARSKMSALIYEHLLENGEGATTAFIDKNKLATLTSAPRSFLDRMDSFGALLRFTLPGLIDEARPGCLRPHHVEHFHLNDPAYCERLFLRILSADIGQPLQDYLSTRSQHAHSPAHRTSIHRLASAIREKILSTPGGGDQWLPQRNLSSLISRSCLNLTKASFGGLIDRFLPDLVDYRDQYALQPHEIHHGIWKDKDYARLQILRAFNSYEPEIPGVKHYYNLTTAGYAIPASVRREAYDHATKISCRDFIAHGKLQSLHIRPPTFLSTNPTSSLEELARFCFQPPRNAR